MIQLLVQYGDGDVEQWYSEQWHQDEVPILDVLWVIDNSGSMMPFQTNLSTNIGSFMTAFINTGADYRMAVITTDRWTFGTIIDQTHPDPEATLSNLVVTGVMGSAYEKGIEMAHRALQNTDYDTGAAPGTSFWRNDATLVVIYVSDEPDFSIGTWTAYTSFFDTLKPNVDMMLHFGVIGDYPSGCTWSNGLYHRNVGFGSGYYDMTQRYNGDWYSICATDWGNQMQDLANTVTVRSTFELEEDDPIESSIIVSVNGQNTTGWTYDPVTNSVVFDENSVPEPSQTITIEYGIWGC